MEDVLLGGPSSFTSLAAALNRFGVKVVPRSKDPSEDKFLGIDRTVGQGKILQGDMVLLFNYHILLREHLLSAVWHIDRGVGYQFSFQCVYVCMTVSIPEMYT